MIFNKKKVLITTTSLLVLGLSSCATNNPNLEQVNMHKVSNMRAYQANLNHSQNYIYGRDVKQLAS